MIDPMWERLNVVQAGPGGGGSADATAANDCYLADLTGIHWSHDCSGCGLPKWSAPPPEDCSHRSGSCPGPPIWRDSWNGLTWRRVSVTIMIVFKFNFLTFSSTFRRSRASLRWAGPARPRRR